MKKLVSTKFFTFLFLLILFNSTVSATETLFNLAISSDTTKFNQNDRLTFYIFFIGAGNVTADYLIFYVDNDICVEKMRVMGADVGFGLQDQGTNMQYAKDFMLIAKQGFINFSAEDINPLFGPTLIENKYLRPLEVVLASRPSAKPGDHSLKVVYMYKGEGNNWKYTSEIMNFHLNTLIEQYDILNFGWNFFVPFLGVLLAIISGIYLFNREKKRDIIIEIIKGFIFPNIHCLEEHIRKFENFQLIDFLNSPFGLLHLISRTYYRFSKQKRFFNKTIKNFEKNCKKLEEKKKLLKDKLRENHITVILTDASGTNIRFADQHENLTPEQLDQLLMSINASSIITEIQILETELSKEADNLLMKFGKLKDRWIEKYKIADNELLER